MATTYQLSFTAAQIDEKLGKIDNLESKINQLTGDSDEPLVTYTNVLLQATENDGITPYNNGLGYKSDTRWSNSSAAEKTEPGVYITGYIPVEPGDIIRVKKLTLDTKISNHSTLMYFTNLNESPIYTSTDIYIERYENGLVDEDGFIYQFTVGNYDTYKYMRLQGSYIGTDSIITINEEIPVNVEEENQEALSEINSQIKDLNNRLTSLESSDSTINLPTYWLTHLDEKIENIRRTMEATGRNKSAFFFYSDAHWNNDGHNTSKLIIKILKYLYNNTSINKINFGGDIISEEDLNTDVMKYLWDWKKQLRDFPYHHSVIGNHDDGNTINNLFDTNYIYSYLFAPEENNDIVWGGDFYYYIDDKTESTRYLYLDVFYDGSSEHQLAFIKNAIKTVPAGWHIIAFSHAWFENNYETTPMTITGWEYNMTFVLNMFDNYNARIDEFSDSVGKVELCIGGHYHMDHYALTEGGIPVIILEADKIHDRSGTMPEKGTTDESAASAIIFNYTTNLINIIRIGRGQSFTINAITGEKTIIN